MTEKTVPTHNVYVADAVQGRRDYPLTREISRVFLVTVNDVPVSYEVILRLNKPTKENGKIQVGTLKDK